jgi:Putative phage serine protease XkdF
MTTYAYNPDPKDESKAKLNISDAEHTSMAAEALSSSGFRGNKVEIPEDDLPAVKRKVRAAYKKFYPDKELPSILKASEMIDMFSSLIEKMFGGSTANEPSIEEVDEEMISYEVVYEPLVKDAHGEWMTSETIEKACQNFNKNLEKGVVQPNLFHLKDTEAFTIESTWVQKELDVKVVQTGEVIKAGAWICKLKYNDESLWDLKKQGVLGGVSIGGIGRVNQETGEITDVTFDGEGS